MRKCLVILTALLILLSFAGCREKPRILLNDEYLQITQTGGRIVIYSHTDGKEYNFRIARKHATETPSEGYTAVESDNIKIVVKPKKIILYDKSEKQVYTLRLFFGHLTLKPFSTGIFGRKG